jgi:hypothetical protein
MVDETSPGDGPPAEEQKFDQEFFLALAAKGKDVWNAWPRDPAQLAKLIVDIATGEVDDRELTPENRGVDPAASAMGRKGGKARAANMSAEERLRIAKNAASLRWAAKSGDGT